jgi:hypothetical protein
MERQTTLDEFEHIKVDASKVFDKSETQEECLIGIT